VAAVNELAWTIIGVVIGVCGSAVGLAIYLGKAWYRP